MQRNLVGTDIRKEDLEVKCYFYNRKTILLVNEKRDVGMAKHFSKKYGNKGVDYPVSAI